jgi:hypothetical protein
MLSIQNQDAPVRESSNALGLMVVDNNAVAGDHAHPLKTSGQHFVFTDEPQDALEKATREHYDTFLLAIEYLPWMGPSWPATFA